VQYYIKEWQEDSVSLITEDNYPVELFASIDDAIEAYACDCNIQPAHRDIYTPVVEMEQDTPDLDYIY